LFQVVLKKINKKKELFIALECHSTTVTVTWLGPTWPVVLLRCISMYHPIQSKCILFCCCCF